MNAIARHNQSRLHFSVNALDEEWGEHRLLQALQSGDGLGPSEIIRLVMKEAQTFAAGSPQFDDMTLLVIGVN